MANPRHSSEPRLRADSPRPTSFSASPSGLSASLPSRAAEPVGSASQVWPRLPKQGRGKEDSGLDLSSSSTSTLSRQGDEHATSKRRRTGDRVPEPLAGSDALLLKPAASGAGKPVDRLADRLGRIENQLTKLKSLVGDTTKTDDGIGTAGTLSRIETQLVKMMDMLSLLQDGNAQQSAATEYGTLQETCKMETVLSTACKVFTASAKEELAGLLPELVETAVREPVQKVASQLMRELKLEKDLADAARLSSSLKAENEVYNSEIQRLEGVVKHSQQALQTCQSKYERDTSMQADEIQRLALYLDIAERNLDRAASEHVSFEMKVEEAKTIHEDVLSELGGRIKKLEADLKSQKLYAIDLIKEKRSLEDVVEEKEGRIKELIQARNEVEDDLRNTRGQLASTTRDARDGWSAASERSRLLAGEQDKVRCLRSERDDARADKAFYKAKAEEQSGEIEMLKAAKRELETKTADLEERLASSRRDSDAVRSHTRG
ncbi:hypothetical protein Rhopal_005472-T1 [Rhodotorula paludigena]|uniref:Uncharacterized protein n=1 Tax=Rhodotorula paludigena TaxID=86838 RepID=A0AAV5GSU8_9BASI|nr:hypothetical protein Rhopal_005472-T1 [Rhodotorula paludigena]